MRGHWVSYGHATGALEPMNLSEKSGTFSQPVLFHYTVEFLHEIAGHVFSALRDGILKPSPLSPRRRGRRPPRPRGATHHRSDRSAALTDTNSKPSQPAAATQDMPEAGPAPGHAGDICEVDGNTEAEQHHAAQHAHGLPGDICRRSFDGHARTRYINRAESKMSRITARVLVTHRRGLV